MRTSPGASGRITYRHEPSLSGGIRGSVTPLDNEFADEIAELEASLDHLRDLPAPACRHHLAVSLITAKHVTELEAIIKNGLQAALQEIRAALQETRTDMKEICDRLRKMEPETKTMHTIKEIGKYGFQTGKVLIIGIGIGIAGISGILTFFKYVLGVI